MRNTSSASLEYSDTSMNMRKFERPAQEKCSYEREITMICFFVTVVFIAAFVVLLLGSLAFLLFPIR